MSKASIKTLVEDVVQSMGPDHTSISDQQLAVYGASIARHARDTLNKRTVRPRPTPETLYASEIGDACPTRLWHKRHGTMGLPMGGSTELKFLVGDFYEETLLLFAEASGHEVTDRQREVVFNVGDNYAEVGGAWSVHGHIDAVIDGYVVDVKSASSYAYDLYTKNGLITDENNSFGYVAQLNFYSYMLDKPGLFWVADKSTGEHDLVDVEVIDIVGKILDVVRKQTELDQTVSHPNGPEAFFDPVPFGKKGNMKLITQCSYCPFKKRCFPTVRAFKYAKGKLEYLTTVVDTPSVEEVQI
jgi:hypothetical protein